MFKPLIKNTSWLFVSEVTNKGVFFLATLIIARVFGAEVYGQFNLALSFILIFSILADFGINNTVIRDVARDKDKASQYISNGLVIKIFLSFITLVAIFISTSFLKKPSEVNILIYILSLYVIFNSYNTFLKSVYRAFENMRYEAFSKIIEGILFISYLIIISLYFKNIHLAVMGFAIASFVTLMISFYWIHKYFSKFKFSLDKKVIKFLLKESWPFALAGIFVTLYFNVDTVMVSLIRGDVETGLYSASYNFIFGASLFPSLMSASLYPYLSRTFGTPDQQKNVSKWIGVFFLGGLLFTSVLFSGAYILINLFYGINYAGAVSSLKILSLILPFSFACTFCGTFFSSINKQLLNTFITCFAAVLNIFLNLFLIKHYGQVGAAIASLISFIAMFAVSMFFYRKYLKTT